MLKSKDLRRNSITIFNSILSARLICILDFNFAETSPVGWVAWPAACCASTDLGERCCFSINVRSCTSDRSSPRAKKNLTSPAYDVYSVPVQAA
jgi:hypothetical protein